MKEILTDEEKEYLSTLLKPLKKQYREFEIIKCDSGASNHQSPKYRDLLTEMHAEKYRDYYQYYEYIMISFGNRKSSGYIELPDFKKGKYYKGLKTGEKYSLEELGL